MSLTIQKCIEGWTNTLSQLGIKADIVFFGDSLTYYGNFSSCFPDKRVVNLGLRGDTIDGMIQRVDQLKVLNPDRVYLMAGINDVGMLSSSQFYDKYLELCETIIEALPNSELILQSMLPVNTKDFGPVSCNNNQIMKANKEIVQIAKKNDIKYIDLYSMYVGSAEMLLEEYSVDGIHLEDKAYAKWNDCLLKNK